MQPRPYYHTQLLYPPDIVNVDLPYDLKSDVALAPLPLSATSFSTNGAHYKLPDGYITENIKTLHIIRYPYYINNLIHSSLNELVIEDYHDIKAIVTIPKSVRNITLNKVNANVVIESDHIDSLKIICTLRVDFRCSYIDRLQCDSTSHVQPNRIRILDLRGLPMPNYRVNKWTPSYDDHTLECLFLSGCDTVANYTRRFKSLQSLYLDSIPSDINIIDPSVKVIIYGNSNIYEFASGNVNRVLHINNSKLMRKIIDNPKELVILNHYKLDNSYIFEVIHKNYIPSRVKSALSQTDYHI